MDKTTVKCKFCCKEFSGKHNLNRHMKIAHQITLEGVKIADPIKFKCSLCDKNFNQQFNLNRHMHSSHSDNSKKYECNKCGYKTTYPANIKRHLSTVHKPKEESSSHMFKCSMCSAKYKMNKHLNYHKRKVHGIGKPPILRIRKCPICKCTTKVKDIYRHFEDEHAICVKSESLNFNSMADFLAWKLQVEKKTASFFNRIYSGSKVTTYRCHRCGYFREREMKKRCTKINGTCKINGFCPAMMQIKSLENDNIGVLYVPTHVGHENDLKHLRLPKDDRKKIATLLASKVPYNEVLKSIKSNSELQRAHLINKSDLRNIEISFHLNNEPLKKHPYDPISVEASVNELRTSENTTLLVYKPQFVSSGDFPQLKEEDFLFIFMSVTQRTILEKYGHDAICIDKTHNLNNFNFNLYTVLTMDETQQGFPVAFMFTNRQDETVFNVFLNHIKEVSGCITPNTFMSDIEDMPYTAWCNTMEPVKKRIYCTWHVLKAWRGHLQKKIKRKEKRECVFKMLQTLLYELDEVAFKIKLEEALTKLSNDKETNIFHNYFQAYYVNEERYRLWAYCFNINASISMSLENYNKVLKCFYLKGKDIGCLDKTQCVIQSLVEDELVDLAIKFQKDKLARKLEILRKRHEASLSLDPYRMLTRLDDKWQVLSLTETELYTVKQSKNCTSCHLQCLQCNSCFHQFVCSCMDNAMRNNMCEHIHLVCRTLADGVNIEIPEEPIAFYVDADEIIQQGFLHEVSVHNNEQNLTLEQQKTKVLEQFKLIEKYLLTEEQVNYVNKHLENLITKLQEQSIESLQVACNNMEN